MSDEPYDPNVRLLLVQALRLRHWNLPNLSAPYWRLYWNSRPGAGVWLNGRETPLTPERLVAIPPDTPFASRHSAPVNHVYIHFLAGPPFDRVGPRIYAFPARREMRTLAREVLDLTRRSPRPERRLAMRALALVHYALGAIPDEDLIAPRADPRVTAALARLEEGPLRAILNPVLAREARMSTNAFLRLFKAVTGRSPQAHFKVKRIEKACMLLHYSDEGIKEIAEATGFCDRYHFSRVFKKVRGVSPAQFRRRAGFERRVPEAGRREHGAMP